MTRYINVESVKHWERRRTHYMIWTAYGLELNTPDSKIHGANMGPIWGRQDPDGPHVGPMNFAIWDSILVA